MRKLPATRCRASVAPAASACAVGTGISRRSPRSQAQMSTRPDRTHSATIRRLRSRSKNQEATVDTTPKLQRAHGMPSSNSAAECAENRTPCCGGGGAGCASPIGRTERPWSAVRCVRCTSAAVAVRVGSQSSAENEPGRSSCPSPSDAVHSQPPAPSGESQSTPCISSRHHRPSCPLSTRRSVHRHMHVVIVSTCRARRIVDSTAVVQTPLASSGTPDLPVPDDITHASLPGRLDRPVRVRDRLWPALPVLCGRRRRRRRRRL